MDIGAPDRGVENCGPGKNEKVHGKESALWQVHQPKSQANIMCAFTRICYGPRADGVGFVLQHVFSIFF